MWTIIGFVVYVLGFCVSLWAHSQMPVTRGLALLRSIMWPSVVLLDWPGGSPEPMD